MLTQSSEISFFMRIEPEPPRVTHQQKKVGVRNGKPFTYEDERLKSARELFMSLLSHHRPDKPWKGPIYCETRWYFKGKDDIEYMTVRPDADNLNKLLQDCLGRCGFFKDDSQVTPFPIRFKVPEYYPHGIFVKLRPLVMTDNQRSRIRQFLDLCGGMSNE